MSVFDDPDLDIGDMIEQEQDACDFFHDHMGQHDIGGPPDDFWDAVEEHQVSGHDESQQGEAATQAAVRSDEAGSNLQDDAIVIENQPISECVSAQVDVNERNRMLHGDSVSSAATPIVAAHMESPRTPSSASAMEGGSSSSHEWHGVSLPVSSSGASPESMGSGSSTSNAESMLKKRRVRSKAGDGSHQRDTLRAVELRKHGYAEKFMKLRRKKQGELRKKFRNHVHYVLGKVLKHMTLKLSGGSGVLHCSCKADWAANRDNMIKAVCYDVAIDDKELADIRGAAAVRWFEESGHVVNGIGDSHKKTKGRPAKSTQSGNPKALKNQQVFGTWNGKFGVTAITSLPPKDTPILTLESIVQKYPSVKAAWAEVKDFFLGLKERFGLVGLSFAMEICTRSWKEDGVLRLHVHAWLLQNFRNQKLTMDDILIPGANNPFLTLYGQEMRRGMCVYSASFYCVCRKNGQIFSHTTKEPHFDYQVKPDWVIRLYSAGKVSREVAQQHLVAQVTDAKKYIQDLTYHQQCMAQTFEQEERDRLLSLIVAKAKPQRSLPEVDEWEKQYDEVKDRYKFLVLGGASGVGKTRFVQGRLVKSPQEALVLDCADAVVPALKGNFDRRQHKLILFDEAHAEMIIRCKKLFQASINPTTYGSSATNCNIHTVWLHGIRLVIASNVWASELARMDPEDREWINDNSVYVFVDRKLWVE